MRQFVLGSVTGGVLVGLTCLAWVPSTPASEPAPAPTELATSTPAAAACPAPPPVAAVAPAPVCPVQARSTAASAAADAGSVPAPPIPSTAGVPPPPPMSAEHARILATPAQRVSLPELHARLLEQPKDAVWSADTEDMIRRDLAAANDRGEFDIPTVECRATMCEVLAFGSAPNSAQRWNRLIVELQKSWSGAGLLTNFTLSSEANGRAVIVSILERSGKP